MKNNQPNNNSMICDEENPAVEINGPLGTYSLRIAREFGVSESIFVAYLWSWIKHNAKKQKNYRDDRTWTYSSASGLSDIFQHWSRRQVQLIINKCVDDELILIGNYNKMNGDKTNWYALTDKAIEICMRDDKSLLAAKDAKIAELERLINEKSQTIEIPTKNTWDKLLSFLKLV